MARDSFYIAIVDDEESVRRAISRLLISAGYAARGFESGDAFLESLTHESPSCVILDFYMPAMNGPEILAKLKKQARTIPVIVISGSGAADTGPRALAAGAGSFLLKPVEGDLLLETISHAMNDCCG